MVDLQNAGRSLYRFFGGGLVALIFAVAIVYSGAAPAQADEETDQWRVAAIAGRPYVTNTGVIPVALDPGEESVDGNILEIGDVVAPGMWIVTPSDSRALLVRGNETIIVAPGSRMGLPIVSQDGLSTTILHSLGSLLLSVETEEEPHFQVITPFLTAVVKGTTFTTTVEPESSQVHVFAGTVKVSDGNNIPTDSEDLAVMFVEDDPDADFEMFVLNGPAASVLRSVPIEISSTATLFPLNSVLMVMPGQTAGVALDPVTPLPPSNTDSADSNNSANNPGESNFTRGLSPFANEEEDNFRSRDNDDEVEPTTHVAGVQRTTTTSTGTTLVFTRRAGPTTLANPNSIPPNSIPPSGGGGNGGQGF